MFERFLKRRFHIARHHAAPFSKERQLYLAQLISEGRARLTLKYVAELLLAIMRYLPMKRRDVTVDQIKQAAEKWGSTRHHLLGSERSRRLRKTTFIFHAIKWLRLTGRLREPANKRQCFQSELDTFLQFQRDERGLASSTISHRQKYVTDFLTSIRPQTKTLKQITPEHISRYFTSVDRGWGRSTVALHVEALRAFFRFAESNK